MTGVVQGHFALPECILGQRPRDLGAHTPAPSSFCNRQASPETRSFGVRLVLAKTPRALAAYSIVGRNDTPSLVSPHNNRLRYSVVTEDL